MIYLFLLTIGPVQEFIASAQRTRDLHFGSWLLSELSRVAAYVINAQRGYLIFPAPEKMAWLQPGQPFSVANRILALVEMEPGGLAAQVRVAVDQRLHEIRDRTYQNIALFGEQRAIAYAQIDDLIELVWVALPYQEGDYYEVRRQLESLMTARKHTYAFQPVTWGKDVPKSSLDGQLESVILESEYPPRNATAPEKRATLQHLYESYGVAGLEERLSGVDLLKRSGRTAFDPGFPSTSHMAALPFLQRMKRIDAGGKQKLHSAWDVYANKIDKLAVISLKEPISRKYTAHPILDRYDGALLFEGRLPDLLSISSTDTTQNEKLLQAADALRVFYNSLDEQFGKIGLGKERPSTYYALLQADGDSMDDLIDALAESGHEQHRELSQALSRFAASVREIVNEDYQGALVYAGGDDVLAFLPLHTVLACAVRLKTHFHEALKDLAARVDRHPPTLSIGIAIVHQLASLREARRLAHDAEQQAKREDGKNALAITVSKRGGEDYRMVGKWGNIDARLAQLITYCRAASIPVGMAYELRDLVLRLSVPRTDPQYAALQNVMRCDMLRILLRKLTVPVDKLPPEQVEKIEAFLRVQLDLPSMEQIGKKKTPQVAEAAQTLEEKKEAPGLPLVSVDTFINELVIAQMLAEVAELAQLEKE